MTDLVDVPPGRPSSPASPRFLNDVYEAACLCNKCSMCQATCPAYVTNPVEWETARGRVGLIRDAIEGRLELADIAEGPLSTCLTCDNCVIACPPRVPTSLIVTRARQELAAQTRQGTGRTFAFRAVLPRVGGLRALHVAARAAQVTGLYQLAVRTGMTRWLGAAGAIAEQAAPLPSRTAHSRLRDLEAPAQPRGRVGLLVCCYQNLAVPEATEAIARTLTANGFEVVVPELACSGLPAKTLGDRDAMLDMGVRNLDRLREQVQGVDAWLGDSASCTRMFQEYGELFGDDRVVGAVARSLSPRTEVASHWLATRGVTATLGPLRWRVAVDEPCSYPVDGPVRTGPRTLLSQVPGLRLVPLEEAFMCCGGPGEYFHREPERSTAILQRKMERVVASGCEVLVTENVSCLLQLRRGAERWAPRVRVMHVFEVLQASIDAAERGRAAR